MRDAFLRDFNLVGGTALALHLGHRVSEDLDLFTSKPYELVALKEYIQKEYSADVYGETSIGLRCFIKMVKTDFINYPYPPLAEAVTINGLRMLQVPDIASMKLSAINNRGARRDFYDLYFLMHQYSLEELIGLFMKKYRISDPFSLLRSLTYFNDAEKDFSPRLLSNENLTWTQVKKFILKKVNEYVK